MFSKYICINQETPSDCGAACLTTIARYMGVPASITAARVYTGTDQTGVSVLGLIDGAKSFGLVGKAMRGTADTLDGVTVPAIAHVVQNGMLHYVVLYKIVDAKVIIADPAAGLKWISRSEFVKMWTGVVLLFTRAEQTTKRSLRFAAITRFAEVIEPFDFYIAEILVASFLLAILSFAAPIYLQVAVDSLLQKKDSATLTKVIIGLMAVLVCRACLGILRGFFLAHVGRKADASIISTFCRHVVRLPMNFFQGSQVGNVISHLGDAIKIRELLSVASIGSAVDAACLACGFGLLLYYSVSLTLIMIGSVVTAAVISFLLQRKLRKAQRTVLDGIGKLQSHLVEAVSGISTLKTLNAEPLALRRCEQALSKLLGAFFRANMFGLGMGSVGEMLLAFGLIAALWWSGLLVIRGQLTIGQMIAYYSILSSILQPVFRLVMSNQSIQDSLAATERIGELMDLQAEPRGQQEAPIAASRMRACELQLCDVTFRYAARTPTLHRINLSIPQGTTLALVGESGSGKSTLAKLIIREFEPQNGVIRIDGKDIRELDLHELRSAVGYLEQESFFFSGSIEDNLRYGKPEATPEELRVALRRSGLLEFETHLKMLVGERGVNMSSGQKQRLALARLLLRDPRLTILDEPTSNLDAHSELEIQRLLRTLQHRSTILLIAHRLSLVRIADSVAVLHKGRVVETGTHKELLAAGGAYSALWHAQMGADLKKEMSSR